MSMDGKAILAFVQEIRKFCRQISELLGTADGLMSKSAWQVCSGKKKQRSAIVERGSFQEEWKTWFPNEVFRFYKNEGFPNVLAFICVMLDDRGQNYENFHEPLLAAGWFDYGQGNIVGESWEWWFGRFHGYMENRKDDGTVHVVNPKKDWPQKDNDGYDYKFQTAHTFAVPLVLVADTDTLKSKITDSLIRELNKAIK